MQKVIALDYYRLGALGGGGHPVPTGSHGLDSYYDWYRLNLRSDTRGCVQYTLPTQEVLVRDETAFPGVAAYLPLVGWHMPVCDRVSVYIAQALGSTDPVVAATPLVLRFQLRLGIPLVPEPVGVVKLTLPTINDGGLVIQSKGSQAVAGELWGYVPLSAGAVPFKIDLRILADNVGECCDPHIFYGPMGSSD